MAVNNWQAQSKARFGQKSGGGGSGVKAAPKAGMGRKDGGKTKPTPFGTNSGGGAGPKGADHPLNAPKGIGLRSKR